MTARFEKPSLDKQTYDPQNILADVFDRSNHTGTQTAVTISDFEIALKAITDLIYQPKQPGEPNGFTYYKEDSTLSCDEGARTVSVTPTTTSFEIWSSGTKYTKTTAQTVEFTDTEGLHFFFFDGDGVLQTAVGVPLATIVYVITHYAICAMGYWDATNHKFVPDLQDERHGSSMPSIIHLLNHLALGVIYESGLIISVSADEDGSSIDHISFSGTLGELQDEDLRHDIAQHLASANVRLLWREGASGYWRMDETSPALVRCYPSGRAYYNQYTGGAWQVTQMTEGYWQVVTIYSHPGLSGGWAPVMGQAEYATLEAAQTAAAARVNLGALPAPEYKLIATVIVQSSDSYSNTVKSKIVSCADGDYVDWRYITGTGTPTSGGGGLVSSVNGQPGPAVVLTQDDIGDGTTNKQYSATDESKLAGIAAGAEVNVNADWTASSGDGQILNKPTIPTALAQLTGDVTIATPALDQILRYNGTNWINGDGTVVNGGSGVDLFYVETLSDVGSYLDMSRTPDTGTEHDDTVVVNNNKVLIDGYISAPIGIGGNQLDAGVWTFDVWGYASLLTLPSQIVLDIYKRTSVGVETLLFSVQTSNLTGVAELYSVVSTQQAFSINPTDRLLIKVSGQTTNTSNTTVHFFHCGTARYSHVNTPLVQRHNDLSALQGGTGGEFYHLTNAELTKLSNIASGAEVNVQADWNEADSGADDFIKNKPTVPTALSQLSDDSTHRLVTDANLTTIGNQSGTNSGNETTATLGTKTAAADTKATPIDADIFGYADSEATNILKKFTWANIKSVLKTYFDSLYTLANLGGVPTSRQVNGHALSSDVTVSKTDVGLSNVANTLNISTTTDPTINDDTGDGYSVNSRWTNTALGKEFVCLDATTAAAVWAETTIVLGESSTTAYRGDRGKTAYDHSQVTHAPSSAEQNVQADWNEADSGADDFIKNKPTISGSNTGDQTLNGLLPTQTGNNGKVLKTDGSNAAWQTDLTGGGGGNLDDLADVAITTPTAGQELVFDGANWVNSNDQQSFAIAMAVALG